MFFLVLLFNCAFRNVLVLWQKSRDVSIPFISVEVFLDNMQFKFHHTHEKIKVLDQIPPQSGILELPYLLTSSAIIFICRLPVNTSYISLSPFYPPTLSPKCA